MSRMMKKGPWTQKNEKSSLLDDISPSDFGKKFPLKILVVEDNIGSRTMMVKMLWALGYSQKSSTHADVYVADDGLDGVKKVRKFGSGIDLIFMDQMMPRMNGTEATKVIRKHQKRWGFAGKIVEWTVQARPQHYLGQLYDDRLLKPHTKYDLIDLIKRIIMEFYKGVPISQQEEEEEEEDDDNEEEDDDEKEEVDSKRKKKETEDQTQKDEK